MTKKTLFIITIFISQLCISQKVIAKFTHTPQKSNNDIISCSLKLYNDSTFSLKCKNNSHSEIQFNKKNGINKDFVISTGKYTIINSNYYFYQNDYLIPSKTINKKTLNIQGITYYCKNCK